MNCIIVHGCPSNIEKAMNPEERTYDKHWIPWLKKELEEKGIKTSVPLMPTPWEPDYNKWRKEFEKISINEESVLVGHSCGSSFLVRWLGETETRVKKLILVAPSKISEGRRDLLNNLYDFDINENIKNRIGEIIIFVSDDDYEDIIKSAELYHKKLEGKLIELNGRGHFTLGDMGTKEFPELLEEILK